MGSGSFIVIQSGEGDYIIQTSWYKQSASRQKVSLYLTDILFKD